jgi:hypothetical protein
VFLTCIALFISSDIQTWHSNIEQHASDGVNKILIGNKSDWTDKKAVTEEQGRALADEFGIKFMETSAKVNEGVEEAFFTLARSVLFISLKPPLICFFKRYQSPTDRFASGRGSNSRWYFSRRRLSESQSTLEQHTDRLLFIDS